MKSIILVAVLITAAACQKKERAPSCERDASAHEITYPDGQVRKSEVVRCSYPDGRSCSYYLWVNDPSVTFTDCED